MGFFIGSIFGVTSGFDRKWAPNVVPVERDWVEEGISGFKVWWMMRSFGGFFHGVNSGVTSGFDRKWAPNVVPVESNWVEEGILWMPSNAN